MSKLNATFSAQLAESYGSGANLTPTASKGSDVESAGEGEGTPSRTIAQTKQVIFAVNFGVEKELR